MDEWFSNLSRGENIDLLAPLLGLGVGIGIGIVVALALSFWYFFVMKMRNEDALPVSYYSRKGSIQVSELRKQIEYKKKKKSAS